MTDGPNALGRCVASIALLSSMMGSCNGCGVVSHDDTKPHFYINEDGFSDVEVVFDGPPLWSWEQEPDLKARVIWTLRTVQDYWGSDRHSLDGWTIVLVNHPYKCYFREMTTDGGCTNPVTKTIKMATVFMTAPCFEGTVIAHEMGHVANPWDALHVSPTFRHMKPLFERLQDSPMIDGACKYVFSEHPESYQDWEHSPWAF